MARNLAALREARGWTQRDLALEVTRQGLMWTSNKVTQIETLRRALSPTELLILCWLFEVPIGQLYEDLLTGPDDEVIALSSDRYAALRDLRAAARGEARKIKDDRQDEWRRQREREDTAAAREELRRVGAKLDLTGEQLDQLSIELTGRGFLELRDSEAGDLSDLPPRSAQTKRGHATRAILERFRSRLERYDDLETVRRNLDKGRRKRLDAGDPL